MFEKPFKKEDFDTSSLMDVDEYVYCEAPGDDEVYVEYPLDMAVGTVRIYPTGIFTFLLDMLNELQLKYSRTGNDIYKKQIEALLPGCYKMHDQEEAE